MRTLAIVLLVLVGLVGGFCSYVLSIDFVGGGNMSSDDIFFSVLIAVVPLGLALYLFLTRK